MPDNPYKSLLANYAAFVQKIDQHVQALAQRYPDDIACKKGCDRCCRNLTLFPVEAFCLSFAFSKSAETLKDQVRKKIKTDSESCPLLIDRACALYENRPVICRTHGYPIYMEQDGQGQIDFCPDNFKNIKSFSKKDLLHIEQLNETLSAINRYFISSVDTDPPLPDRIAIEDALFLFSF